MYSDFLYARGESLNKLTVFLFLYLLSAVCYSEEVVNQQQAQQPEDKILVYTPLPVNITRQLIKPLSIYLKQELGLETVIPIGECDAYEKFEAGDHALIMPIFPLWRLLAERGYTPLVETSVVSEVVGISKQEISGLEDFKDKRVAVDLNYKELHQFMVEDNAPGIWSTMNIVDSPPPDYSHIRILNGEAEYGLIGTVVWGLTSPAIKDRMHSFTFSSHIPKSMILVHPQLSQERKQRYQQTLTAMHANPDVKQWLNRLTFGQYIVANERTKAIIRRIPPNELFRDCWGNKPSEQQAALTITKEK